MKVAVEIKEVKLQLTPIEVYRHFKDRPYSLILDSGMDPARLGRYSFVTWEPFALFKSKNGLVRLWEEGGGEKTLEGNPFQILKDYLSSFEVVSRVPGEAPPFTGGAAGYFGYDLGEEIEEFDFVGEDDLQLPDCILGFYDKVFACDHLLKRSYLCALGRGETGGEARDRARDTLGRVCREVDGISRGGLREEIPAPPGPAAVGLKSNFTRQEYCRAVERAREYIAAGDIYQVNLSQRLEAELRIDPFLLYTSLRRVNPAPFASFLNFGEVTVASASPERFLKVWGKEVETRPIKGTRPRGSTPERDEELKNELLNSEKDRAELVMIIDLERNDLGRVCLPGSVKVPELITLETYATVYHLVSTVKGVLPPGKDVTDLLQASFPGGSITGAPKIRAMEIIDELERLKRNIYTGSIGYISFSGKTDLNIVIRTFVIKGNRLYFQVGGGIVADSQPEAEYQETLDKARALLRSLGISMEEARAQLGAAQAGESP